MLGNMSDESVRSADWFPSGIITELVSLEEAPAGFSAWRFSTSWGTWQAYHLENLGDALTGEVWGEVTDDILHLPLVGMLGEGTISPVGGIKHGGRDLIQFYPSPDGTFSEDILLNCERLGAALGGYASESLSRISLKRDEEGWNNHLKKMEDRLKTSTLWRAPYVPDTRGTETIGYLDPSRIHISDGELRFLPACNGILTPMIGKEGKRPAISDIASAITMLHSMLDGEELDSGLSALIEGWRSTAPASVQNRRALDAHRGGLHIWIYDAMLDRLAMSRATGAEDPLYIRRWLSSVSTIQARMFRARSWSALSLICYGSAALVLGTYLWGYMPPSVLLPAPFFIIMGLFLKHLYRSSAPSPW